MEKIHLFSVKVLNFLSGLVLLEIGSHTSPKAKKSSPVDEQGSRASAERRRSSVGSTNGNRTSPPLFRKLDVKKPSNVKLDTSDSSVMSVSDDKKDLEEGRRFENPKIRRALFKDDDYEEQKLVYETGCRVVPSNEAGGVCRDQRDCEDLSLIRKQLVQIENQQSDLLDILQVSNVLLCSTLPSRTVRYICTDIRSLLCNESRDSSGALREAFIRWRHAFTV